MFVVVIINVYMSHVQMGRYLVGQCKVAYLRAKASKLIPILIPLKSVQAVELLITHRRENGIVADNKFVFAETGMCIYNHSIMFMK